jgi:hypothetical protein
MCTQGPRETGDALYYSRRHPSVSSLNEEENADEKTIKHPL